MSTDCSLSHGGYLPKLRSEHRRECDGPRGRRRSASTWDGLRAEARGRYRAAGRRSARRAERLSR